MTLAAASRNQLSTRLARPLGALAGATLLAPTLLRPGADGPVLCPLRFATGVWCPTCGMTRAVGWLAHGDLQASLRYHPLAPLLLIECAVVAAILVYRHRTRRDDPSSSPPFGADRFLRPALVANALLVLVVWAVRLKSGSFDDLG
jgi:hypothetical protein